MLLLPCCRKGLFPPSVPWVLGNACSIRTLVPWQRLQYPYPGSLATLAISVPWVLGNACSIRTLGPWQRLQYPYPGSLATHFTIGRHPSLEQLVRYTSVITLAPHFPHLMNRSGAIVAGGGWGLLGARVAGLGVVGRVCGWVEGMCGVVWGVFWAVGLGLGLAGVLAVL
jgi:hypothetical protein